MLHDDGELHDDYQHTMSSSKFRRPVAVLEKQIEVGDPGALKSAICTFVPEYTPPE